MWINWQRNLSMIFRSLVFRAFVLRASLFKTLRLKRLFPTAIALCGLCLSVVSPSVQAASGADNSATASLSLCGAGNVVVTGKVVGKASLFLANCQQDWRTQPAHLRFSYQASIPGWAFRKAANVLLERNVSAQQWKNNKAAYEAFTTNYQAIKKGDVYELNYQPEQQLMRLTLNQNPVTQMKDAAFADYFSIWLGNKPFSATLKQQLLR